MRLFEVFEVKALERRTDEIGKAFVEVLKTLEEVLVAFDFERSESAYHPNSFGSMYATFTHTNRKERQIRFVWDGKESTFGICICQNIKIKPYSIWKELFLYRYNQFDQNLALDDLKQQMITEVKKLDLNFINE